MNPKHLKLIIAFLERYSEVMSNAGCNDWNWPEDWTLEDKKELFRGLSKNSGYEQDQQENDLKTKSGPPDIIVAAALRGLLSRLIRVS